MAHVRGLLGELSPEFMRANIVTGLSSGQGLIYHVRDGAADEDRQEFRDPGVIDKRLLVVESEFAGALKTMSNHSNNLSTVLREGWDGNLLATLTRTNPMKATDPHLSLIVQITADDLHRRLDSAELFNGFVNRFLIAWSQRTQVLPFGGSPDEDDRAAAVKALAFAVERARRTGKLDVIAPAAREWWTHHYEDLTRDRPGKAGSATQRGAAQIRRIALLFAALDGAPAVDLAHLTAAHAIWQYAADSATCVFAPELSRPAGAGKRASSMPAQGA